MSAEFEWVAPGDIVTNVTGRVRTPDPGDDGFSVQTNAEEGSVGSSEIVFDNPLGPDDFYPVGGNAFRIYDNASTAADPYIYAGGFGARTFRRGRYRTGVSGEITAQLQDANFSLSKYVIRTGQGGDRPQETDTARMAWLRGTGIFPASSDFDDDLFIIDTAGVTLSAADLTDYTAQQILSDMAQQSGRNYFIYYDGDAGKYLLVYALDSGTHLTSALRFSNVLSDVDLATTFEAGQDWEAEVSPERLASYVAVRYANGRVDEEDAATAAEFTRRDVVMDASLVKTASVATARAIQYLNELDDEEFILKGTVYLPASKASQFRAGMRVEMKASHLPGLSDFTWVRLLNVSIIQLSEDPYITYALRFEGTYTSDVSGSCATVIDGLSVQDAGQHFLGGIDFGPVTGDSITPIAADDMLSVTFIIISSAEISLLTATIGGPWTAGTVKPGNIGGAHSETFLAYAPNTPTPTLDWTNYAYDWNQLTVVIPTAATAWAQEATVNGGNGEITFGSPPSGLLILAKFAEGPTVWSADPSGADWVKIADRVPTGHNPAGSVQIWVACAPDDPDDLLSGIAGSSWWAHCVEVAIT